MLWKGSVATTVIARARKLFLAGTFAVVFAFPALPAFAQTAQPFNTTAVNTVATQAGINAGTDLFTIIGNIINIVFGFMGVLLLCYLVYAGYLWMTAPGPEQVEKAKGYIKNAVIGLLIMVSSFAVSRFILDLIAGDGGSGGAGRGAGVAGGVRPGSGFPGSAGALGGGVIEYHLPERDATAVARNTSIIIAFKEAVDPASAIVGYSEAASTTARDLNTDAIHIFRTGQEASTSLRSGDVEVFFTEDHKTMVLRPRALLGSPSANTDYSVRLLGGERGLRVEAPGGGGSSIFAVGTGLVSAEREYSWRFEVSTVVDNTPPKILSVVPYADGRYAPNVVIQMNFDKPLNPISASGLVRSGTGFENVEVVSSPVAGGAATRPDGQFTLSNQFRTIEFVSTVSCGVNSCGRQVYCLPFSSNIAVRIRAASLSEAPPQARIIRSGGATLFDGIVDAAGNSFDGNGNGTAQGPGEIPAFDDYQWRFQTEARPNLAPPQIRSVSPGVRTSGVAVDAGVTADFDSVLQASTVSTEAVRLETNEPEELADTFWWTVETLGLRADGGVLRAGERASSSRLSLDHRPFLAAQRTPEGMVSPEYIPRIGSEVQNIYQNCFNPASSARCAGSPYCCDDRPSRTACAAPSPLAPLPLRP